MLCQVGCPVSEHSAACAAEPSIWLAGSGQQRALTLAAAPAPDSPQWMTVLPMASRKGSAARTAALSPPHCSDDRL